MEWWQGMLQGAVGGLLALTGAWMVARYGARDKKREHVRRVAADLIGQTDTMWTMHQSMHVAVFSLMNAQRNTSFTGEERVSVLTEYDNTRRDAIRDFNDASRRARALAAELELLDAGLQPVAARLVKGSEYQNADESVLPNAEAKAEQVNARADFIRKVRDRT